MLEGDFADDDPFAFRRLLWAPLKIRKGRLAGGVIFAREKPWPDRLKTLAGRISETCSHALSGLTGDKARVAPRALKRAVALAVVAGLIALAFIAMAVTVRAPAMLTA